MIHENGLRKEGRCGMKKRKNVGMNECNEVRIEIQEASDRRYCWG